MIEDCRKIAPEEISSQTADTMVTCNNGNSTGKQPMILIPEVEFNRILGEKNQEIAHLLHDNSYFVYKLKQMREWSIEAEARQRDIVLKNYQLERCLTAENGKRQWVESRLKAALTRSQEELEAERSQWNKEKLQLQESLRAATRAAKLQSQWERDEFRLQIKQLQVTSSLRAELSRSKEELEAERSLWNKEKLDLQESLTAATQAVDEQEEEISKIRSALAQAVKETEQARSQWDRDETRRQEEQLQVTSSLRAELSRSKEELEAERSLWYQDKLQLQVSLRAAKQAAASLFVEKCREKQEKEIMENQLIELQKIKAKKKSVFKRFRKFLCCSGEI
ncbi:unnamed protein product [Pleuronectes platessa]|uniref:Uncharacterized protein n=1 Tax=Pleuronectes platessa TaxID=8262 RepID=A0A9N7TY85_PLEPL|nr:unnamed protein product [Pleuronectes platessa]